MLSVPFFAFWFLVFLARNELGWTGVVVSMLIWGGLLAGCLATGLPPYAFVVAQVLLDIVLILIVFGGDIHIR